MIQQFMEFLRQRVTETAANTFTCGEIRCPVSETESLVMLVHRMEIYIPNVDRIDSTIVWTSAAIGYNDANERSSNQSSVIHQTMMQEDCGSEEGSLSEYHQSIILEGEAVAYFNPPLVIAQSVLYPKLVSLGMPTPNYANFRIAYTLEKVSRESFIAALVRHIG